MPRRAVRYREVAESLRDSIIAGNLAVGERLPGELALMDRYSVSRHTVREALRILDDQGLVRRRPGVGTVVCSTGDDGAYVQTINSPVELLQYPDETYLTDVQSVPEIADSALAQLLRCDVGEEWIRITGARRRRSDNVALCWAVIYVVPEYGDVIKFIDGRSRPVCGLIEDHFGEEIQQVTVDLDAVLLDEEIARSLDTEPGAPAMNVVRRYIGRRQRQFEISITTHPADRFSYSLRLAREWLAPRRSQR